MNLKTFRSCHLPSKLTTGPTILYSWTLLLFQVFVLPAWPLKTLELSLPWSCKQSCCNTFRLTNRSPNHPYTALTLRFSFKKHTRSQQLLPSSVFLFSSFGSLRGQWMGGSASLLSLGFFPREEGAPCIKSDPGRLNAEKYISRDMAPQSLL